MFRLTYLFVAMIALTLCACGGGANNAAPAGDDAVPADGGANASACGAADDGSDDGGPTVDPDAWKKVTTPTPEGWDKLGKTGRTELTDSKNAILKKPPFEFGLLASFANKEVPHKTSGTEEEWKEWRDTVSAVFVYNVSKISENTQDTLKKHGSKFVDGFKPEEIGNQPDFAGYRHPDNGHIWLACVNNSQGTYILVSLVRDDDARELMTPYPVKIQPE